MEHILRVVDDVRCNTCKWDWQPIEVNGVVIGSSEAAEERIDVLSHDESPTPFNFLT